MGKKNDAWKRYLDLEGVVIDASGRLLVLTDVIREMGADASDTEQADRLLAVSHMLDDVRDLLDKAL